MQRTLLPAIAILSAGLLSMANAQAPQSPPASPSNSSTTSRSSSSVSKTRHRPATTPVAPLVLKTDQDKISYAIGMQVGNSLHRQSVQVDPKILARGLSDALAGGKLLLTDQEAKAVLTQLQQQVQTAQMQKMQALAASNKTEGEAFLASNKTKADVVALPSGLQYKILQPGTGPKPTASDMVVCNYRGTLLNGKEFDSSYKHGEPVTIPVGRVIKGWTEALQLMPVGSKWQLYIPADLAYGERGAGGDIGPNATLVFDVELLSIKAPEPQPAASPAAPTPSTPQNQTPNASSMPQNSGQPQGNSPATNAPATPKPQP
ncbi:MAG TPA: FKBP-type peptidyl-prolyl cis-trans isomerase [Acidobacteriaceae bacterium]